MTKREVSVRRCVHPGDRVRYHGNPKATGTIQTILLEAEPFVVKWDASLYEDSLGPKTCQYRGDQLIFLKEGEDA